MANQIYGEADAARIAESNALLAAYEASADLAQLWERYALVEQRMNAETQMGRFAESNRIRSEMNRISRTVGKRLGAEARASVKTYSLAELAVRSAALSSTHSNTEAA